MCVIEKVCIFIIFNFFFCVTFTFGIEERYDPTDSTAYYY